MPDIDHFKIGNEIALPELYALCKSSLCDLSRILTIDVAPPAQIAPVPDGASPMAPASDAIQGAQGTTWNLRQLLQDLHLDMNCFAIYTRQSDEPWRMRYLGETTAKRARATLSACLLPASTRAHPVYARFNEAHQAGCQAGLRLIHVEPDTLRHFIQEKMLGELRSDDVLDWHPVARNQRL
jgi:hypothetical protein